MNENLNHIDYTSLLDEEHLPKPKSNALSQDEIDGLKVALETFSSLCYSLFLAQDESD